MCRPKTGSHVNGRTLGIVKPEPPATRQDGRLSMDPAPNGFADLAVPRQLRSSFGNHSGSKERQSAEPEDALDAGWLQEEAGDLQGADGESLAPPSPLGTQHSPLWCLCAAAEQCPPAKELPCEP